MELKEGFIICDEEEKRNILEQEKGFKNYIFLSYEQLKDKLYGTVSKEALFLLMDEYHLSYDLASEYMKYVPYVNLKQYNNLKLDSINSVRSFLIKNQKFSKDEFFYYRLNQFPITFLKRKNTKEFENIIQLLKEYTEVIILEQESKKNKPLVHKYNSIEDEVYAVCNEIIKLKRKGVSYDSIYLMNLNENYTSLFERMKKSYHIPFNLGKTKNISHVASAKVFFKLLNEKNDFHEIIEEMKDYPYIDSIIKIISDYSLEDKNPKDYIYFFERQFKEMNYKEDEYEEMVNATSRLSFNESEYVFYLGLNQGITPKVYKDDEYLSDVELSMLGLMTSYEKNINSKQDLKWVLENTKNIYVSYPTKVLDQDLLPSSIINELELKVITTDVEFGYSKQEDDIRLGVKMSLYKRLGDKDKVLDIYDLNHIPFNTYDHSFKGIDKKYMESRYKEDSPLSLSYSTMKLYFECPFKFYCNQVLDLNTFDSSTATRLGSYSHKILEDSYDPSFDFDKEIVSAKEEYLKDISEEDYLKDSFYLNQMNEVLKNLISFNKSHEALSNLDQVSRECHIKVLFGNYYFHGFIDKLLYRVEDNDIYAAIIDYKTGKDVASLNNVKDGFNLQLPSYMWLLNQYEPFKGKKIHIIGIYLQKVRIIVLDNSIDLIKQMNDSFMLEGFTVKDYSLIPYLDPDYSNSTYIKSMKLNKDLSFYRYAKIMDLDEQKELIDSLDKHIKTTYEGTMNARFNIEPKRIGKLDKACTFCDFKDVCFKDIKDYIYLEEDKFPKGKEE